MDASFALTSGAAILVSPSSVSLLFLPKLVAIWTSMTGEWLGADAGSVVNAASHAAAPVKHNDPPGHSKILRGAAAGPSPEPSSPRSPIPSGASGASSAPRGSGRGRVTAVAGIGSSALSGVQADSKSSLSPPTIEPEGVELAAPASAPISEQGEEGEQGEQGERGEPGSPASVSGEESV